MWKQLAELRETNTSLKQKCERLSRLEQDNLALQSQVTALRSNGPTSHGLFYPLIGWQKECLDIIIIF